MDMQGYGRLPGIVRRSRWERYWPLRGHTPRLGRTAGGAQRYAPQGAYSPAKPEGDASTPGVGARNCDITAALTTGGSADVGTGIKYNNIYRGE